MRTRDGSHPAVPKPPPAKRARFARRMPDHVTDELVKVLVEQTEFIGFNGLFRLVYRNLKERNAVSGGEEMLRLRAYEKLQQLCRSGHAEKEARTRSYRGLPTIKKLADIREAEIAAEAEAKAAAATT